MPLRHVLYRCPACGQDPVHGERDLVSCPACGARYTRGEGARIAIAGSDALESGATVAELLDRIEAHGGVVSRAERPDGSLRYEAGARARRAVSEEPVRDRGRLVGFAERYGPAVPGTVTLTDDSVRFRPDGADAAERWPLTELRSVQGASSSLQLRTPDGVVSLRFPHDSPLRWEGLLHHALARARRAEGMDEAVEHQPRIVSAAEAPSELGTARPLEAWAGWHPPRPRATAYRAVRLAASLLVRLRLDLEVEGREHVPPDGPFVLAVGHHSLLDPLFAQVACPRPVHTLTKSTQFTGRLWRALLLRLLAFPTRRYRVDPQAVRTSLRVLAAGRGLGIFPEGERSWDGRPAPLRRGAVRLMAAAGVPVVPCAVAGSYDVLPRWSRSLATGRTVRVRFGPPLDPVAAGRSSGEGDPVARAADTISGAMSALGTDGEGGA